MRRPRVRPLSVVAGFALVGMACSAPVGSPASTEATASATASSAAVDEPADATSATAPATPAGHGATDELDESPLAFTARRLSGGTFDGTAHRGTDVVLWMWAPWCPQCNREAPHVAEAVERYGDRVTFVGVPGHDSDEAHRAFVEEHGLDDLVHAVDDDGSLWARFGINYQPAWVFVDEDGDSEVVAGGLYEDLDARLQALVDG